MCTKCERDLDAMKPDEWAHDSRFVMALIAKALHSCIFQEAGVHAMLVLAAVGHGILRITERYLHAIPGETMTPMMRAWSRGVGEEAADRLHAELDALEKKRGG